MFCGCIATNGRQKLISIDFSINSHIYCDITQNHVIHDFSYMKLLQDNAKPHKSIYTRKYFINNGIVTIHNYPTSLLDLGNCER